MKNMSTRAQDIRCPACNALLAKREGDVVAIRRNDLQVSFAGDGHASVLCYRPSCRSSRSSRRRRERRALPGSSTPGGTGHQQLERMTP